MQPKSFYLLGLLLVVGCGPNVGRVSGTVTFKGEQVPDGTVSFVANGKVFEAEISNGQYEIVNLPPGEFAIALVRLNPRQPDPNDAMKKARKQLSDGSAADLKPGVVTDPVLLDALRKELHLLPSIYASPQTSDLRFAVAAGRNTFDITLVDK